MRVRITSEAKQWLTLAEAPFARQMVEDFKGDETSAAELLKSAATAYQWHSDKNKIGYVERVLEAKAEICANERVDRNIWNAGRLDIWIEGTVEFSRGFLKIGACLSDIYQLGSDAAAENLLQHAYIRAFAECK